MTPNERRENGLPSELVVIGNTGDGNYYCIVQRDGEESPVVVYQTGVPLGRQRGEEVARDFGEFLLNGVRDEI